MVEEKKGSPIKGLSQMLEGYFSGDIFLKKKVRMSFLDLRLGGKCKSNESIEVMVQCGWLFPSSGVRRST